MVLVTASRTREIGTEPLLTDSTGAAPLQVQGSGVSEVIDASPYELTSKRKWTAQGCADRLGHRIR